MFKNMFYSEIPPWAENFDEKILAQNFECKNNFWPKIGELRILSVRIGDVK